MIIGVHGKIGSGKQTAAKMMAEEFKKRGYRPFYRIWAGKLKDIVQTLTSIEMSTDNHNAFEDGITDYTQEQKNIIIKEYDMSVGRMLQVIGTDLFRDRFSKRTWINALLRSYYKSIENSVSTVWFVADTRFPNEADEILDVCGGEVITVYRPNNDVRDKTTRDTMHESETAMDNYDRFSHRLANDGTLEDLRAKVVEMVEKMIKKEKI